MSKPLILTICVNYNNDQETQQFVSELLAQKGDFSQRVIIVDNSESPSLDSSVYNLFKSDSRVLIINSGKNLGYFGGAAWGLDEYIKEFPLPEWIIVCNTDINLIQQDLLSNLCALYSESRHAVIAPSIISGISGRDQNPYMKFRPSRWRMHFYKWVFHYPMFYRIYEGLSLIKQKIRRLISFGIKSKRKQLTVPVGIYAPHGSFIIFHRSYFEAGGTLDHGVLLFGEEIFVAETAQRLRLSLIYEPRLRIIHEEHAATNGFKSKEKCKYEAAAYCADTFFK